MSIEPLCRHLEIERDRVALSPDPMDSRIAVRRCERDRLAIDSRGRALRPTGNAQLEIESRRRLGIDFDAHFACPWIVARLMQGDLHAAQRRCGFESPVEGEGDAVLPRRYRVAGPRRDQARP